VVRCFVIVLLLFLFNTAQAAGKKGGPTSEIDRQIQLALKETKGRCKLSENPHSFACTQWTYTNNTLFPLFKIESLRAVEGEWFMATYVNTVSENTGPEFFMGKNPNSPTQPMGVFNVDNNTPVGKMRIKNGEVVFENWRGHVEKSVPGSLVIRDPRTIQFELVTGKTAHTFHCRDFNRNQNHHLLCDWWIKGDGDWSFKGYFGFLTADVWEVFLKHGKR